MLDVYGHVTPAAAGGGREGAQSLQRAENEWKKISKLDQISIAP